MEEALALIAAHGPLILFLIILADQSGLPVPMEQQDSLLSWMNKIVDFRVRRGKII